MSDRGNAIVLNGRSRAQIEWVFKVLVRPTGVACGIAWAEMVICEIAAGDCIADGFYVHQFGKETRDSLNVIFIHCVKHFIIDGKESGGYFIGTGYEIEKRGQAGFINFSN